MPFSRLRIAVRAGAKVKSRLAGQGQAAGATPAIRLCYQNQLPLPPNRSAAKLPVCRPSPEVPALIFTPIWLNLIRAKYRTGLSSARYVCRGGSLLSTFKGHAEEPDGLALEGRRACQHVAGLDSFQIGLDTVLDHRGQVLQQRSEAVRATGGCRSRRRDSCRPVTESLRRVATGSATQQNRRQTLLNCGI